MQSPLDYVEWVLLYIGSGTGGGAGGHGPPLITKVGPRMSM